MRLRENLHVYSVSPYERPPSQWLKMSRRTTVYDFIRLRLITAGIHGVKAMLSKVGTQAVRIVLERVQMARLVAAHSAGPRSADLCESKTICGVANRANAMSRPADPG